MKVETEEQDLLSGMEAIKPYLRTSLNDDNRRQNESEFVVSFLGTGGGAPTKHRIPSCTALRLGGQTYLFDVAEGVNRQIQFSRIMPSSISKIFISHLHGDHIFGLVPVILGIGVSHKLTINGPHSKGKQQKEKPTIEVYGPPGLYNYISTVLTLSCSKINYLQINVIELVGGRMERGPPTARSNSRGVRNMFLSHYPEIQTPFVSRKYLEQVSLEA